MVNPVTPVVVHDFGLHFLEVAAHEVAEELLDVFVLRIGHVRSVVPDASVALLAVDVSAVMGIRFVDDTILVSDVVAHRETADSSAENRHSLHRFDLVFLVTE